MGPDHLESYLLHVTFWPWFRLWPSPWPLSNPEPELCSWHEHDFVWGQSTCPLTLPETLHMFSVNFNQCFPAVSVQNILYSYTVLPMWPWKLNLERHRFLPIFPNCILSSNVFLLNCVVFDGPAELNKFYNTFEGQDHFLQQTLIFSDKQWRGLCSYFKQQHQGYKMKQMLNSWKQSLNCLWGWLLQNTDSIKGGCSHFGIICVTKSPLKAWRCVF